MDAKIEIFVCGPSKDHECDMDGGNIVGDDNGNTWPEDAARKDSSIRFSWGSVTCSVCGRSAYETAVWSDW